MDVKELSQISGPPERHWYYAAKFDLLAATVRDFKVRRIVDIGAGSGVFARLLLERTDCEDALCVDPAYEREYDEEVNGKTLRFRHAYRGDPVDLVLFMDVLEHVDDDIALLREVTAGLPANTAVFITVPAFNFLWSAHDVFLDHRRRYNSAMLANTISGAGLHRVWMRYFYAAIFPLVAVIRLLTRGRPAKEGSDLRPAPALVNSLLIAMLKLERKLIMPANRIAGVSLVALART
jgi:SAM-dependent methyltransferase